MSSLPQSAPKLESGSAGEFPAEAKFDATWKDLLRTWEDWKAIDCGDYIRQWGGISPDDGLGRFVGVNHIGVYLGDYQSDAEVFAWHAHLEQLRHANDLIDVEIGPSYISPRQYGTQGWWLSISLPQGGIIETFACKAFGSWQERSADERRTLMSHVALEVGAEGDVRYVLERFEEQAPNLEVIAYTEADEVGHTYGHLRNNATNAVVEIVCQAANADSDQTRDHE